MTLLVLRPEPGASATVARAAAAGLEAVATPLFDVRAVAWTPPVGRFDAVLATSANALRHAGPALARYAALPLYAVGATTAAAARNAGFSLVVEGSDDAAALLARAAADGRVRLFHPVGREHRAVEAAGIAVTRAIVYAAEAEDVLPAAAARALDARAVALVHSPRAAAVFARLAGARAHVAVAAISARAAAAAGPGWRAVAVAAAPTDAALLAAAARLCEQGAGRVA